MAVIALVTAARVEVVGVPVRQMTGVAGEAITPGAPCTFNSAGAVVNADANGASPLNTVRGIAVGGAAFASGDTVTLLQEGRLDGYNFDSQAYGLRIWVSDTVGSLDDATGTAGLPVGNVEPAGAHPITSGRDKVLSVNIPA
jgi:hypothetical protein